MIYLWVENEGWNLFELDNKAELEKRGISIGDGAVVGDGAKFVCITGSKFLVSY